jgi:hypothetical protein
MYNQKYHQFDSFYNHKFGFHINGPNLNAFREVRRLRPKVIKTLDFSVDIMKQIRQEIPDVFLIGRLFVSPQDFGQLSGNTAQAARQRGIEMAENILRQEVNQNIHHVNGRPVFSAWESLNEVFPESTDDHTQKLFDEYQVAFGLKMRSAGFEPIAFNFGGGNGRGQQWLNLYPGTLETYKYLGFHEYDWPTMDRLHQIGLNGPHEPENLVPGVGEGRGNDGMWRCLRYRRILNEGIRQRYGDQHVAIITECGMTQAVWGGSSHDLGPWANELTVPADIPGGVVPSPIPAEDYWQTLLWYNSELMKDDYVMGACMFVTGATGKPEWVTFEHVGPITDRIYAFQQETPVPPEPPVPPPTTLPPVPPPTTLPPVTPPTTLPPVTPPTTLPPVIPPTTLPPVIPPTTWQYRLEEGPGLGLMVGDIGIADVAITITKPYGHRENLVSGSKPEFGVGGFETYAQEPGGYRIEFLGQRFDLTLSGRFTKVTFTPPPPATTVPPVPPTTTLPPVPPSTTRPPVPPPVTTAPPTWQYSLEEGQGLGLLVGDIGIANVPITITKPYGHRENLVSGSKPEFGVGGFETYAQEPGVYRVEFLDQRFDLTLSGRFTKVTFAPPGAPAQPAPASAPPRTRTPTVNKTQPGQPPSKNMFQTFLDFVTGLFKGN